ncbi:MAG TPA: LysR family transcriptional regulator [Devosiaceae bacterium]|nr:LysR family transcriptional regulator [Devosiaceae bacterium]
MTLEQLRIFAAVAERAQLTRAAEALNLSPSAVSAAIRALEERYGAKLFDRVGRGIALTETGRLFLPEAKAALAAAGAAELALSESTALKRGALRLGASQTVGTYWLPEALMRFHAAYPGIALSLELGNTETVARAVLDGAAELGFIEGEIDAPALMSRVVATDRLVIVVAPGHPWVARAPDVAALAGGRWILREPGSGTRSAFEAGLRVLGIEPTGLDIVMTLPSNEAILTALRGGRFAGAMSERAAEAAIAAGQLRAIDVDLPPRAFRMLWHKDRYRTRAARALEAALPG